MFTGWIYVVRGESPVISEIMTIEASTFPHSLVLIKILPLAWILFTPDTNWTSVDCFESELNSKIDWRLTDWLTRRKVRYALRKNVFPNKNKILTVHNMYAAQFLRYVRVYPLSAIIIHPAIHPSTRRVLLCSPVLKPRTKRTLLSRLINLPSQVSGWTEYLILIRFYKCTLHTITHTLFYFLNNVMESAFLSESKK